MIVTLKNQHFTVSISSKGGELHSIKDNNSTGDNDATEYLWNDNPEVWKFHAPILFPIVGRLKGGYMLYDNRKYAIPNHGFARDLEHNLVEATDTKVLWRLQDTEETYKIFPWHFILETEYILEDKKLSFKTTVINTDTKEFSFSIGSHTGLACPRNTDTTDTCIEDYLLEFEKEEIPQMLQLADDGFLQTEANSKFNLVTKPYPYIKNGKIPLKDNLFGDGHILTNFKSQWVALVNSKTGNKIKVHTKNYPYLVLWQNPHNCKFICIEPWYGIPDVTNTKHQWKEKLGLHTIQPKQSFTSDESLIFS